MTNNKSRLKLAAIGLLSLGSIGNAFAMQPNDVRRPVTTSPSSSSAAAFTGTGRLLSSSNYQARLLSACANYWPQGVACLGIGATCCYALKNGNIKQLVCLAGGLLGAYGIRSFCAKKAPAALPASAAASHAAIARSTTSSSAALAAAPAPAQLDFASSHTVDADPLSCGVCMEVVDLDGNDIFSCPCHKLYHFTCLTSMNSILSSQGNPLDDQMGSGQCVCSALQPK